MSLSGDFTDRLNTHVLHYDEVRFVQRGPFNTMAAPSPSLKCTAHTVTACPRLYSPPGTPPTILHICDEGTTTFLIRPTVTSYSDCVRHLRQTQVSWKPQARGEEEEKEEEEGGGIEKEEEGG